MNAPQIYRLSSLSIIDVGGADAAAIVHNVTTNQVKSLEVGEGRETFITDVRGKTLWHAFLYRQSDRFRLIGPSGQSQRFVEHLDRYTIREDAVPLIRDEDHFVFVVPPGGSDALGISWPESSDKGSIHSWSLSMGDVAVEAFVTRWLGESTVVVLVPSDQITRFDQWMVEQSLAVGGDDGFHRMRITVGFPWYGADMTDANLPQEADRDDQTISFTKGCYLGQETVARLDALGQVQKKLVLWTIRGAIPEVDAKLESDGKTVGRLTSIAKVDSPEADAVAIGFARRSHFEPGATAAGVTSAGDAFEASVIAT
ncbi:CAF17-like 4Fe-4S cluster assembly/insertion protein YgfZ [Rubripirellula tenax]|nr:aminomethyltransferase [Rubripirellula tenax]